MKIAATSQFHPLWTATLIVTPGTPLTAGQMRKLQCSGGCTCGGLTPECPDGYYWGEVMGKDGQVALVLRAGK